MEQVGLLFDMVQCAGCHACVEACMAKQKFEGDPEKVNNLSATAYTAIAKENDRPVRLLCRHCNVPSCVSV